MVNAHGLPYLNPDLPTASRVDDLLGRMSLAEKIGQMTQAERLGLKATSDISRLQLGSVLSGGGSVPAENTPAGWADMVDGYQREALSTPLQIPLLYGVDAVHGHNNVVGATLFPHNIGLGAARDPELVEETGQITAQEVRATGIPWTFSPCLCVTRDERWGRSYESFGEDPALVTALSSVAVTGLQGTDRRTFRGQQGAGHRQALGRRRRHQLPAGQRVSDRSGDHPCRRHERVPSAVRRPVRARHPGRRRLDHAVVLGVQIGSGPVVRMHENTELNTDCSRTSWASAAS